MARFKPGNGEGNSQGISLAFDVNDPAEKRALDMALRLARPHGRRKELFVLFLNALADYERDTGREVDPKSIGGSLIAHALAGKGGVVAQTPQQTITPPLSSEPQIVVTTQVKASAEERANRFSARFK
mgnify:FL=1